MFENIQSKLFIDCDIQIFSISKFLKYDFLRSLMFLLVILKHENP